MRPLLLDHFESSSFDYHTYHLDAHFEMAFARPNLLAEAVHKALRRLPGREHLTCSTRPCRLMPMFLWDRPEVIIARRVFSAPIPMRSSRQFQIALLPENGALCRRYYPGAGKDGVPPPDSHGDICSGFILYYNSGRRLSWLSLKNWSRI